MTAHPIGGGDQYPGRKERLKARLLVKLEYFNHYGSVGQSGKAMIEDAGTHRPGGSGSVIVSPRQVAPGSGLAAVSAVQGLWDDTDHARYHERGTLCYTEGIQGRNSSDTHPVRKRE